MSFAPINQIHQCLHAYHVPSHDRTQVVEAFHYCSHSNPEMFQCVIYDSDSPKAKLIGIEYVISESKFKNLPAEEKPYWHSHQHEVASGLLCAIAVSGPAGAAAKAATNVPGVANNGGLPDEIEKGPMQELYKTYGKTIHTWHPTDSEIPLGAPILMTSTTNKYPGARSNEDLLKDRKEKMGIDTDGKEVARKDYLDHSYQKAEGADEWESTGLARVFDVKEVPFKQEDGNMSKST
ncbi:unnamed protein product [Sympodiomycopsis kandeliae]